MKKDNRKIALSTLLSFTYAAIMIIITFFLSRIVPIVLNYGPESINTEFDIQMSYISYNSQFTLISIVIGTLIVITIKFFLRDVDKYVYKKENGDNISEELIIKVRKICLNLPLALLVFEMFMPSIVAAIILSVTGSHSIIMISKIVMLILSFSLMLAVVSFILTKNKFDQILTYTYSDGVNLGRRIIIKNMMSILLVSTFVGCTCFFVLAGYATSVIEKEDAYFDLYHTELENIFSEDTVYSKDDIIAIAKSMKVFGNNERIFAVDPNGEIITIKGKKISEFAKEYLKQIAIKYDGRLYESYGTDIQGSMIKVRTDEGMYYVGIMYEVIAYKTLKYIIMTTIFLIADFIIITRVYGNWISNSLKQVHEGFESIIKDIDRKTPLPAVANDEIGDLVIAFNDIQKLNRSYIDDIKDKQNMLIERERLASLGQMVGGIAHSMKTPIFSISGGIEGLNDLVDEFDSSIEDPAVNNQDMHEIAGDMKNWLEKMKGQLAYMSEVITAVKGQAVNLSGDDAVEYTIRELFGHISILMKHELQSELVNLNVVNEVPDSIVLKGNINSLVQVLNNLLSNAIQASVDSSNKTIDLLAKIENKYIVISVKDYGLGLPEAVKDKLFKEMITTKGKNGTGLGVFMSYSIIKGKFNGDIKYSSEPGKGTEFDIYLPI
ncbi:MAG: HAMP domain-containing histidine kinase [Clostridia bacterium]|nr:HAMP domain-containing histidine kinase [Clostridia bacterium]